jgi:DNA polymerase III sliding clamp (beta) subunit (PCNA family)
MVRVNGRQFKKALSDAGKFVLRKSTLPILYTVRITACENKIQVAATDMNDYFTVTLDADVDTECSFCAFYDALKSLKYTDEISFDLQGDKVNVRIGGVTATLSVIDGNEFPVLPTLDDSVIVWQYEIKGAEFVKALERALLCVGKDEMIGVVQHILLEPNPNGLFVVATDTHQMLVQLVRASGYMEVRRPVILSKNSAKRLTKIIDKDEVKITAFRRRGSTIHHLVLETHNTKIISLTVDGNYPNWRRIKCESSRIVFRLNTADLAVVDGFPVPKNEEIPRIVATIDAVAGKLMFEYHSTSENVVSHTAICIDVMKSDVERDIFAINWHYLRNIRKIYGDETVTVHYEGSRLPIFIVGTHRYVVMPMQLDESI